MPPTSTYELYSTCRLVRVPVGSVRFEETEKSSFEQLERNVESARGLAMAALENG